MDKLLAVAKDGFLIDAEAEAFFSVKLKTLQDALNCSDDAMEIGFGRTFQQAYLIWDRSKRSELKDRAEEFEQRIDTLIDEIAGFDGLTKLAIGNSGNLAGLRVELEKFKASAPFFWLYQAGVKSGNNVSWQGRALAVGAALAFMQDNKDWPPPKPQKDRITGNPVSKYDQAVYQTFNIFRPKGHGSHKGMERESTVADWKSAASWVIENKAGFAEVMVGGLTEVSR